MVGPIPYIARWELFRVRPTKRICCYLRHHSSSHLLPSSYTSPKRQEFNLLNQIPVCIGFAFWSVLGLRIRCEDGSGSGGSGSLPGIEDGHRCVCQPCSGQGCGGKGYPTLRILQFRYYFFELAVRMKSFRCFG